MSEVKRCTKCGEEKPLNEFYREARSKDGYKAWCKACSNASDRARRRRREIVKPKAAPKYPELYDPEWLGQKYCVELLAPEEIAALIGCAAETVERARRRHGIQPIPRALRAALRAGRAARREEGGRDPGRRLRLVRHRRPARGARAPGARCRANDVDVSGESHPPGGARR